MGFNSAFKGLTAVVPLSDLAVARILYSRKTVSVVHPVAVGTVCCRLDCQYGTQLDGLVRTKFFFYDYVSSHQTLLIIQGYRKRWTGFETAIT